MYKAGSSLTITICKLWLVVVIALLIVASQIAQAQTLTVLHTFTEENGDGEMPYAGVILDNKGNLYGTTELGGLEGGGMVFRLAPDGTLENLLPRYFAVCELYAGLLKIKQSLYSTSIACGEYGGGALFELTYVPKAGHYDGKILYSFYGSVGNYQWPTSDLVADPEGNLYGTTRYGGHEYGTVYEVSPEGTETVLYAFCPDEPEGCTDGSIPLAGLVRDADGNLYGTTVYGGAYGGVDGCGTVFEVTPAGTETVLHSFQCAPDGSAPSADLIMDAKGNLYGTTGGGGSDRCGTVFEIAAGSMEKVLYSFQCPPDGSGPLAALIRDEMGNLYGTTAYGGVYGNGTIFKLAFSRRQKTYTEQVLYSFTGGADGANPYSKLAMDKEGNLYGTTEQGGDLSDCYGRGCGTVFMLTP